MRISCCSYLHDLIMFIGIILGIVIVGYFPFVALDVVIIVGIFSPVVANWLEGLPAESVIKFILLIWSVWLLLVYAIYFILFEYKRDKKGG